MKELNIEEKAKAYDEAVERLRNAFYDNNSRMCEEYRNAALKIIEPIFPELKYSEDELARKEMLEYCYKRMNNEFPSITIHQVKRWLTWLEKLGDKDKFIEKELGCIKGYRENAIKRLEELEKQGEQKSEEEEVDNLHNYLYGEQKPVDKVESKFREGDWVVYKNDICQIVKREKGCNKLITVFGIEKEFVNERNLSTARLWTIQDAKDGDVLATDDWVFIFKELNAYGKPVCYCHYDDELGFKVDVNSYLSTGSEIYPATKEQRDLLFQKIKESGYEWDADKKELKKIEQNPAWSEEDMAIIDDAIFFIQEFQKSDRCKNESDMQNSVTCERFLIFIKDKVAPQSNQEWSEKDENKLKIAIENCYECGNNYVAEWLKSLRHKTAWKPSEEQMQALYEETQKSNRIKDDRIVSLYNDLKKLMEE